MVEIFFAGTRLVPIRMGCSILAPNTVVDSEYETEGSADNEKVVKLILHVNRSTEASHPSKRFHTSAPQACQVV